MRRWTFLKNRIISTFRVLLQPNGQKSLLFGVPPVESRFYVPVLFIVAWFICIALFILTPRWIQYDIALGIDLLLLALVGGIVSSHGPSIKAHKVGYIATFLLSGLIGVWLIVRQSKQTELESALLRDQVKQLVTASTLQATANDIRNLTSGLSLLRTETKSGFAGVVNAINSLRTGPRKVPPVKPPTVTEMPPPVLEKPIQIGRGIVQHLQISQRRTVSTRDDAPFAIQAIIQTDVPSQPTAFMIECDAEIEEGKFFLAGQPGMMGVGYGVQPDKRRFYLRFQFPPFTPESPIVVTLISKADIRVQRVLKAD